MELLPVSFGWVVFLGVPGLLWALGAWANRGHGLAARILGFIVGTDNRLSLSRLQAFLWTLVIFGSFAAAMTIHTSIKSGTADQAQAAKDKAKKAADAATAAQTAWQTARAEYAKAVAASQSAQDARIVAETTAAAAESEAKNQTAMKKIADDDNIIAAKARIEATGQAAPLSGKKKAMDDAEDAKNEADCAASAAALEAQSYAWVQIPAALLALAGIAIGSGVFSSLISGVNGDDKTPSVSTITYSAANKAPDGYSGAKTPQAGYLEIKGTRMGNGGKVRLRTTKFTNVLADILCWKPDGTGILIDLPSESTFDRITIDTPNGKLTYKLIRAEVSYDLGAEVSHYEIADLFRDDKNPENLSLMKFQMFGWTVIAIFIYVYLFLANLDPKITTLPNVDSSIAMLTGISQAGYLVGKGASNVQPNQ